MDLEDANSPEALVKSILEAEPNLSMPVPIQALCARFGITRIEDIDTDGFEGALLTDAKRADGTILAKRGGELRRRFTIAHELVRCPMAHHVPDQPGRFTGKSSDFLRVTAKDGEPRQRREVEINPFTNLMLMPPHLLPARMAAFSDPDLRHVPMLARDFEVGKEAAWTCVQHHPGRIANEEAGNVAGCSGAITYRNLATPALIAAVSAPIV